MLILGRRKVPHSARLIYGQAASGHSGVSNPQEGALSGGELRLRGGSHGSVREIIDQAMMNLRGVLWMLGGDSEGLTPGLAPDHDASWCAKLSSEFIMLE
jgi:hypothetical protein